MVLNKNGWGLSKMIVSSAILLIALLFGLFNCYQFRNSKETKKRYALQNVTVETIEQKIRNSALNYVDGYYQGNIGTKEITIPISNLIYYHFLEKEDLILNKNENCDGYALVKKNGKQLESEAYIKCPKYVTREFKEWKMV